MATMTVSVPDPMKDWIEAQIKQGENASTSDYVRDLVRRDRARREQELTLDELRQNWLCPGKVASVATLSKTSSPKPVPSPAPADCWVSEASAAPN